MVIVFVIYQGGSYLFDVEPDHFALAKRVLPEEYQTRDTLAGALCSALRDDAHRDEALQNGVALAACGYIEQSPGFEGMIERDGDLGVILELVDQEGGVGVRVFWSTREAVREAAERFLKVRDLFPLLGYAT